MKSIKIMRIIAFMIGLNAIILLSTGCKPQQVITEKESSAVLEQQDSLMIKETQIALINSITNRLRNEDFNLNNETVIHEIEYDSDSRISSERFINSNTQFENTIEDYKAIVSKESIDNNFLLQSSSVLQLETDESLLEERKHSNFSLNFKLCFVILIAVMLLILTK